MIFQNTQSPSPNIYYRNVLLTETKEYNFLGNAKGSFNKNTQELSKKGLKLLFSLTNRFMNFSSIPVNLFCKLFDILIRPILIFNSEIWFMDYYFPISRAISRSEQRILMKNSHLLEHSQAFAIVLAFHRIELALYSQIIS
jgi:hypothetical protein